MICPKCNVDLFLDIPKDNGWHYTDYYKCPQCLSHNRHRLLYFLLKDRDNGKMLEYSPVKILKDTFNHYTADFPPRHSNTGVVVADVCDDLTNSQFKDNEFDTVVCSHVLDAILNEDKAIKELHRITKDTALIAFPMFDMDKTIEYGKLLPENYNHFRKPGKDYIKRFNLFDKVTIVSSHKEENKYGLQGEYIAICQKYNK